MRPHIITEIFHKKSNNYMLGVLNSYANKYNLFLLLQVERL